MDLLTGTPLQAGTRETFLPQAPAGINAAMVGMLAAAFAQAIRTSAVHGWRDVAIMLAGLVRLVRLRFSPVLVGGLTVCASLASLRLPR